MRRFKIIVAASVTAGISTLSAQAANTITFGVNSNTCGGAVMCSTDGTNGYLNNGGGQAFNISTINQWFQIDIDGASHLSGQSAEPDKGAGGFLVFNDTGNAITSFSITVADDFNVRSASAHTCTGAQLGNICGNFGAQGGSGNFKFNTQLNGADWDRCTKGTTNGQSCTGAPGGVAADFACGKVTYTWKAQPGGEVPAGAYFDVSFSGWNNNGWVTTPGTSTTFTAKADMPVRNAGEMATAICGTVYVIGGNSPSGPQIADTYAYDTTTNQWKTLSFLPESVGGTMAAAIDGLIYVAGGATYPGAATNDLFIYKATTNQWSTRPLPFQEGLNGCVAAIRGELYVYNPVDNWTNQVLNSLYAYDPVSAAWTQLASPSSLHEASTCSVVDGQLYLVSGFGNGTGLTSSVEAYDPNANTWTTVAPIPVPVQSSAAATLNGVLYVFGGCVATDACSEGTDAVQAYDPNTDTWVSSFATMPFSPPITNMAVAATPSAIFLEGGVYIPGGGFNLLSQNTAFVP